MENSNVWMVVGTDPETGCVCMCPCESEKVANEVAFEWNRIYSRIKVMELVPYDSPECDRDTQVYPNIESPEVAIY